MPVHETLADEGVPGGIPSLDGSALIPTTQLGTGAASATTFLRGDRVWSVPAGGSAGIRDFIVWMSSGTLALSNTPSGITEIASTFRLRVDLTGLTDARALCRVATVGSAGTVLFFQYSTDGGTVWNTLTPSVSISALATPAVSAWGAIPAAAKADVLIRTVTQGGNGVADPALSNIRFQVR